MGRHSRQNRQRRNAKVMLGVAAMATTVAVAAGSVGLAGTDPVATGSPDSSAEQQGLPRSVPTYLEIPRIGIEQKLVRLGASEDGSMELPPAGGVGWYSESVTPGEIGASVIAGFIATTEGPRTVRPGVFSRLDELRRGDHVFVRRLDGRTTTFEVVEITAYVKGDFPAQRVYGRTDHPALRLVTTGGRMRPSDPVGNVVVYADFLGEQSSSLVNRE